MHAIALDHQGWKDRIHEAPFRAFFYEVAGE